MLCESEICQNYWLNFFVCYIIAKSFNSGKSSQVSTMLSEVPLKHRLLWKFLCKNSSNWFSRCLCLVHFSKNVKIRLFKRNFSFSKSFHTRIFVSSNSSLNIIFINSYYHSVIGISSREITVKIITFKSTFQARVCSKSSIKLSSHMQIDHF